jgi:hypothetical protein
MVVELEPIPFGAASAVAIHKGAPTAIPFIDRPPGCCRDVAGHCRPIGLLDLFSGLPGLTKPLGFEPFELFGDGLFDDRRKVLRFC